MKKIFNIISFYLILVSPFFLLSCEDYLEVYPKGSASEEVMKENRGVEALLVGAYDPLNGTGSWREGYDWMMGTVYSDDADWGGEFLPREMAIYQMAPLMPAAGSPDWPTSRWDSKYDGVARANDALKFLRLNQSLEKRLPENRALTIEAEARFLRAYYHFYLQRAFWQIPYIKTVEEMGGKSPEEISNTHPVWDEIETDLQFAIDNLSETPPVAGEIARANKFTAMVVKAYAHMIQNEFSEAKPLLDGIIASGKFKLVDKYYDNYRATTEHNSESIFELESCVGDGANSGYNAIWENTLMGHQKGPAAVGWGQFQPTLNLYTAYQTDINGLPEVDLKKRDRLVNDIGIASAEEYIPTDHLLDPRIDWTIARRGIPYLDWGIHIGQGWIREPSWMGPFMSKKAMHYKSESGLTDYRGRTNARNFRIFRYAHVLLWRAEIHIEDGEFEAARQLINMIRTRAGNEVVMGRCYTYQFDGRPIVVNYDEPAANYKVEPYPEGADAFSTLEKAREAVRMESRLELALDGYRFFDLRRWGIDDQVLNDFLEDDRTYPDRTRYIGITYEKVQDDYWPLPQLQIDLQRGVLTQDPDWQ